MPAPPPAATWGRGRGRRRAQRATPRGRGRGWVQRCRPVGQLGRGWDPPAALQGLPPPRLCPQHSPPVAPRAAQGGTVGGRLQAGQQRARTGGGGGIRGAGGGGSGGVAAGGVLTVPALPRERWPSCWARGATTEGWRGTAWSTAGASTVPCMVPSAREGDRRVGGAGPWGRGHRGLGTAGGCGAGMFGPGVWGV